MIPPLVTSALTRTPSIATSLASLLVLQPTDDFKPGGTTSRYSGAVVELVARFSTRPGICGSLRTTARRARSGITVPAINICRRCVGRRTGRLERQPDLGCRRCRGPHLRAQPSPDAVVTQIGRSPVDQAVDTLRDPPVPYVDAVLFATPRGRSCLAHAISSIRSLLSAPDNS